MKEKVYVEEIDKEIVSVYFYNEEIGEHEIIPFDTLPKIRAYEEYDVIGIITDKGIIKLEEEEEEDENYYEFMGIDEEED